MSTEEWRTAAAKYQSKKFHERAQKFRTSEQEREKHRQAWAFEEWLLTDEGQAALELLDASGKSIKISGIGSSRFETGMNWKNFYEVIGSTSLPILTARAIEFAIKPGGIIAGKEPKDFLPFIRAELDKIATQAPQPEST